MSTQANWGRLKELAERCRDERARRLATLVGARNQAQDKLQMLLRYRQDYQVRLAGATREGIDAEGLRNYRTFLAQLERAIDQQTAVMSDAQQRVRAEQAAWSADQRRVDSFEKLGDRCAEGAARDEARRQQKATDEFAGRVRPSLFFGGDD